MITEKDVKRIVRGPADLEEKIEQLEKQKEILQSACRKAGKRIKDLEIHNLTQAKEIDRLNEYVQVLEMEKR
jgi:cell division protein FtsB